MPVAKGYKKGKHHEWGATQRELAFELKMSQPLFNQLLRGTRPFNWERAKKTAEIMSEFFPAVTPQFLMDATPAQFSRALEAYKVLRNEAVKVGRKDA
jgi:hypothetical protein